MPPAVEAPVLTTELPGNSLAPFHHSSRSLNVTSSKKPSMNTLCRVTLLGVHSLSPNYCLSQESPTSRPQKGTSRQIPGSIGLEIKRTVDAVGLNHPEAISPPPHPWKNRLPQNQSLVPKLGDHESILQDIYHICKLSCSLLISSR